MSDETTEEYYARLAKGKRYGIPESEKDVDGHKSIFRPSSLYIKTSKVKKEDTVRRGRAPEKKKLLDQFNEVLKREKSRATRTEDTDNSIVRGLSESSESEYTTVSKDSVLEVLGSWLSSLFDKIKELSSVLSEKFTYALDTKAPKIEHNQVGNQSFLAETHSLEAFNSTPKYDIKKLTDKILRRFNHKNSVRAESASVRKKPKGFS